ncbi:hypothetical protein B0T19DRAFT_290281 [Cercophora scortea]|uniref:Uncharacterized protein n=1 Tax=Cercophora scortea TaxID=314031 RepID=A0AAE0I386_9PEZI|nr:hypothetical protein B0T19DRAFT_290281 [Cercophora scortea]
MADINNNEEAAVPEELFHTILTVIDYHADTSGSTRTVYVLGTHTSLAAAKAFTLHALQDLKYEPEDFAVFATRATTPAEDWKYGDGVLVYAEAPAGQIFLVGIDTKPNTESLPNGPDSTPLLPRDYTHLHYVLQNKTDYNQDKSGAYQSSEIEGCYVYRADAVNAALALLAPDKAEFAQYDERTSVHDDPESDWPYGEDVFVHAVAETGENYTVAVRTVPGAHKRYAKKH